MTRNLLRAGALSCALLTTTCLGGSPAYAQTGPNPPPVADTQSPTGVSFQSGAFSLQAGDLSIGQGGFPAALTLDRSYLSSLDQLISTYAGFKTQGWTHNFHVRVGNAMITYPGVTNLPGQEPYRTSVIVGTRSIAFLGGSTQPTGGFPGSYTLEEGSGGETLTFTGAHSSGYFTFTDRDGSVLVFNPMNASNGALQVQSWTAPDGTRADFSYGASGLQSVFSNRGLALLFEYGAVAGGTALVKACAVNRATTNVSASSACPSGVQTVTYQYSSAGTFSTGPILIGATDAVGNTTGYAYSDRNHLSCVTLPGQSGCQISNSYSLCERAEEYEYDPPGMRNQEAVLSQTTATGETYSYSFPATRRCPAEDGIDVDVTMTLAGAQTRVVTDMVGLPKQITDPLGRTRQFQFDGPGRPSLITEPEGNRAQYAYDTRGNRTETRLLARSGTGLADIVSTASFPSSCSNPKTCNQPASVTDANGNTTDYTYDATHGGVLTETGPAVGGIRPQTRHDYAQRYAWVANGSGGYAQAATPVWLRTATSICRTSAATGNPASPCATAGDEVRTSYDYGPNSGPNTLLLRGQAVTADGQTLRTCFTSDANGRRIAETGAGAQLTQCQ